MSVNKPHAALAVPPGARPAEVLLGVSKLTKSFGATRALRSCSFELIAGEVHAIVGENGSGKSTLVKILSGVHHADGGSLELIGAHLSSRRTPRTMQQAGVITVFQEVLTVGSQSVLENIWLGSDGTFRAQVQPDEKRRRAAAALSDLLPTPPPLDTPIASLTLSERQACCIARAVVRSPKVLILDESTSALDVVTRDRLFTVVRRLCRGGSGVVFISHRMEEIDELADRITVLRSGESVATLQRGHATTDQLVQHMTGSEHLTSGAQRRSPAQSAPGEVLLQTKGLVLRAGATPIDIEVRAGELVGLAGLEGQGQEGLLHALRGAGARSGDVLGVDGQRIDTPRAAFSTGVAYVPRDRRAESIFPSLSISENFAAPTMTQDRRWGLITAGSAGRRLNAYIKRLAIRLANARQPITVLSGGNQQKVIVARWLAAQPRVLLLNDPTRGVDLGAKRDLYRLLERLTAEGMAVVMLSTEVDEHVELMDRVLVFVEGAVAAEVPREQLSREGLVEHFFGSRTEEHSGLKSA